MTESTTKRGIFAILSSDCCCDAASALDDDITKASSTSSTNCVSMLYDSEPLQLYKFQQQQPSSSRTNAIQTIQFQWHVVNALQQQYCSSDLMTLLLLNAMKKSLCTIRYCRRVEHPSRRPLPFCPSKGYRNHKK